MSGTPLVWEDPKRCEGSGRPAFLDYGGPTGGVIPRCPVCRRLVAVDAVYNAVDHPKVGR